MFGDFGIYLFRWLARVLGVELHLREHYPHQVELAGKLNVVPYNKADSQSYLRTWAPSAESESSADGSLDAESESLLRATSSTSIDRLDEMMEATRLADEQDDHAEETAFDALLETAKDLTRSERGRSQ
jgi:hypothetical protein